MAFLLLYFLFVTTAGTAPAVVVALYFLWDGPPRTHRPWPVAPGTRRQYGQQIVVFWIFSPIWLGALAIVFRELSPAFGSDAGLLLAVGLYWSIVSLIVGRFGSWLYRAPGPGFSIGAATFVSPAIGVGTYMLASDVRAAQSFEILAPWLPIIVWNVWVIGTIVKAESPGLRAGSGRCHHCGYNLTGLDTNTCPECGADLPDAALEKPEQA